MDRENEYPKLWHLLLLGIACAAVIWAVMYCVHQRQPQPQPEPEVVTVDVPTEAKAAEGSVSSPSFEGAKEEEPTVNEYPSTFETALVCTITSQYYPQGMEWNIENYLGWKTLYPEGYANLIRWGRGEIPPLQLDPPMIEACKIAAAGQNIDEYLAHYPGSPLGGHGLDFARAGYTWGINPYLLVGLTAAESTFAMDGALSRNNHNAWGMLGPNKTGIACQGGACWWPDWPSAIDGAAYFVSVYWPGAQTAYDLSGYCVGNPPDWIRNVEVVRNGIGGVAY